MKTFQEVRNLLSVIEPDEYMYSQITVEDIPVLQMLLKDSEAWVSARSVFALSRLKNEKALALINEATKDKRTEVRVAVAVALPLLAAPFANQVLTILLTDEDEGVRKYAIHAIPAKPSEEIKAQLKNLAQTDNSNYIKTLSREKLTKIN